MTYHILNGDAMIDRFYATGLTGEPVVTRECLIDGSLAGDSLNEFFQTRAKYISGAYGEKETDYYSTVVTEFEKLLTADNPSEFNLWFGYDLFCRVNMWFVLSLLNELTVQKKIFAVYPSHLHRNDIWKDFAGATPSDLLSCYETRVEFNETDLALANKLWLAYKSNNLDELEKLSSEQSACFPYLQEVCMAHIDRFAKGNEKGRPEKVIEEIIQGGTTDFYSVFTRFSIREGIYGFGDSQLKVIYDKVLLNYC